MRIVNRPRIVLVTAAALAVAAFLAAAAGHAAPAGWSRISGPGGAGAQLGLARTGGVLHIAWSRDSTSKSTSIFDTRLSAAGAPLGTSTVATGWDANGGLALLAMPDHSLRLFVAGGHAPGLGSSSVGINTLTASPAGASWTLAPGLVWGGAVANAAAYIGATLTKDGQPVTAWSGTIHANLDPASPDVGYGADMGASLLATDAATGAVVLAGETIAGKGGTFVKQVLPAAGPSVLLPSALQVRSSGVSARIGAPGVYVAYADTKTVRLYRYGGTTKTIAGGPYDTAGVFAGPAGRLWLVWGDSRDGLFVTRSNTSVTAFEPVQKLALPADTNGLYSVQGEGSAGPLDLFADVFVGAHDRGFRHAHVLGELSLSAKPSRTAVTVLARDAGDPIADVTIAVGGRHLRTNAKGQVTVPLRAGSYTAAATAAGYLPASTRFTVR